MKASSFVQTNNPLEIDQKWLASVGKLIYSGGTKLKTTLCMMPLGG